MSIYVLFCISLKSGGGWVCPSGPQLATVLIGMQIWAHNDDMSYANVET